MPILPIETSRLLLRDFVPEDFPAVLRYACDPEVTRYMLWGPNGEPETRIFLEYAMATQAVTPRADYQLAVVLKDTGELIGGCEIGIVSEYNREGEIGYIYRQEHWGRGYSTEAARALVRLGFETLHLHRIFATCHPDNRGSARVLEKCGMQCEGLLRQHKRMKNNTWRDSCLYSILEQEYEQK